MPNQLATARAQIYTMRYLNQHTAQVIKEINEAGEPAAITLRGRFVAVIAPLTKADAESTWLYSTMAESENVTQLTGESTESSISSPSEATRTLLSKAEEFECIKDQGELLTYTVRELNQKTAHVVHTVNQTGQSATITRRGLFVAFIIPLANADVESALLGAVLEHTENAGLLLGGSQGAKINSTKDADKKLARMEAREV